MNNIRLVIPFSRHCLAETLIEHYKPMNVILHPVLSKKESNGINIDESWIKPLIIPDLKKLESGFPIALNYKLNYFIKKHKIVDDDYYCFPNDDDMYAPDVFEKIKNMDSDVVVISMLRGNNIPAGVPPNKRYSTSTLYANANNMMVGKVGGEQLFIKGKVFKTIVFDEQSPCSDGIVAEYLKKHHSIQYEKYLYALFNYFEPGRWNK